MTIVVGAGVFLVVAALLRLRPAVLTAPPRWTTGAVVAASAIAAALAPGEPTGNAAADAVLLAVLGAAVAWGGARSTVAAVWCVAGALVGLLVARCTAAPAAGAAAGVLAAPLLAGISAPVLGAVGSGLALQVLLRLDWPVALGASLVLGVVGVLPALVVAARTLPRSARRPVTIAVLGAAAVAVAGGAAAAVAAATVAHDVEAAIGDAQRGLDLVGDDEVGARDALLEAEDGFATADDRFGAWWALPARVVPFVAQQARAVGTMASAGAELARTAADALDEADVDAIRPVNGAIDLTAVADVRDPLRRTDAALRRARERLAAVDSPWLLPPVDDRLVDLADRVEDAAGSARLASDAVEVLPALLGADGPRHYLLLVQQPAEARGSGGFPGNFGILAADGGQLDLLRFGRVADVQPADRVERALDIDTDRLGPWDELVDLSSYFENITVPPDFPTAAEVARQVYAQSPGGSDVDGVIGIDPLGFAALLEVTGPVTLDDGTTVDSSNAADLLLHEQYIGFAEELDPDRVDFLGEMTDATWARISSGALPGPRILAGALGPAVAGRHLQLASFDPVEQALYEAIGSAGSLPAHHGSTVAAGVVTQNMAGNKIDYFLRREVTYDVEWDPSTGEVTGQLVVTLRNEAPSAGLPRSVIGWGGPNPEQTAFGENLSLVTLYASEPLGVITVDGEDVASERRDGVDHGFATSTFVVRLPAGSSVTITGEVAASVDADVLRFTPIVQASVADPPVAVDVATPNGWRAAPPVTTATGARTVVVVDKERANRSLLDRIRGDNPER